MSIAAEKGHNKIVAMLRQDEKDVRNQLYDWSSDCHVAFFLVFESVMEICLSFMII